MELLLRGFTLPDMVEQTSIPALAIVEAFQTEEDFARLSRVRRTMGEFRAMHLERLKLDALTQLIRIGRHLKEDYPDGMTGDQVRLIEAERRACVSLVRLSAFPRPSESRNDERSPRLPDSPDRSRREDEARDDENHNGGATPDTLRELQELAGIWAKVPLAPPRRTARNSVHNGHSGSAAAQRTDSFADARDHATGEINGANAAVDDGESVADMSPGSAGDASAQPQPDSAAVALMPAEMNGVRQPQASSERRAAPRVAAAAAEGHPGHASPPSAWRAGDSGIEAFSTEAAHSALLHSMDESMRGLNRAARRRLMRARRKAETRQRHSMNDDHPP